MDKKYIKLAIRIFITSVLLIWVFSRVDRQQFLQAVPKAKIENLVLLWGTSVAFLVLRAAKMQYILKQQSLDIGIFMLFKVSAVTSLYSLVLPGIISSGAKWYILKKATGKGTIIFNGMLYNQLSENIIMSVCALTVLIFTNPTSVLIPDAKYSWLLPAVCSVMLLLLILVTVFLLGHRTSRGILNVFNHIVNWLPSKMQDKGRQILREATMFQRAGWRFHTMIFLFTIGQTVGSIIVYILAAKAVNLTIPLTVYIWLTSAIFILGHIPITIANLGLRDITLVSILAAYGLEKSSVLLMSMLLFSTVVLKAAVGAGFLIQWSLKEKRGMNDHHSLPQ
jgi:uncharacterized membrane protein YbhN (UPF0104 family)